MKEVWGNKWNRFIQWMREKYRLTVRDKAYEERLSFDFSRGTVLVVAIIGSIILIGLTTLLIAFTPLREYIPGYGSGKQSQKLFALRVQVDSLSAKMKANEEYIRHFHSVLTEDYSEDTNAFKLDTGKSGHVADYGFAFSKEDSELLAMELVRKEEPAATTLSLQREKKTERHLPFQPVKGKITVPFQEGSDGILVSTSGVQPLHAADDGVVFQLEDNILCVMHPNNRISVFRQFQRPMVKKGQQVRTGQILAYTYGESQPTGFEFWIEGKAVNPKTIFAFE